MNDYERLNAERDADWEDFCEDPTDEKWRNFAESDAALKAKLNANGMPIDANGKRDIMA